MKPGSLVVALKCGINPVFNPLIKWLPVTDESTVYMIREIGDCPVQGKGSGVRFEEGIIGHNSMGIELQYPLSYVREIQAPPSEEIAEVVRDAQENYSLIDK